MSYFINFVEYAIMNPQYYGNVAGRIEVHDNDDDYNPYAEREIGYLIKDTTDYYLFRERWDFKDISEDELAEMEEELEDLQ